jgi:hypothetical protein
MSDNRHCCEAMRYELDQRCDQHPHRLDCADALIYHSKELAEYGIIIHDGGSSYSFIHYCPWCGTKLPESKREI